MPDALPAPPSADAALVEWAVWNASIGRLTGAFKIFPVVPNRKHPLIGGWQTIASDDPDTVARMWRNDPDANVGLAIQPGFVAIDGDVYKPGNEAKLQAFEAEHGELPQTLEFQSARGGFHLIYATSKRLGNAKGTLPDFGDVRGHGGLIVGPGSKFERKQYLPYELRQPARLPEPIAGMLVEKKERVDAERELPPFVKLDDPLNEARYIAWLRGAAKPSIDGEGGNNNLAAAGAMGACYALSDEKTVALLLEHFNPRCEPLWTEEEIEKHGGSGYRSATSRFGNMARENPELMFKARTSTTAAQPLDFWERAGASLQTPIPARRWVLGTDDDGWIPQDDLTFLYGPGGAGKTALAAQINRCVQRGEPLFGMIPVQQMPTFLIACEDSRDEMRRRFKLQGVRFDDEMRFRSRLGLDNALMLPRQAAEDTPFYQELDHTFAALPEGPKLLTLDNLAQMYMGSYIEPAEIARFLNGCLRRLATRHLLTILMLAHPSEAQKQSGDGSFGGVGWSAGVRSRLYFDRLTRLNGKGSSAKREDVGTLRVLRRPKANYTRDKAEIILDWKDWNFVPAEAPPEDAEPAGDKQRKLLGLPPDELVQIYIDDWLADHKNEAYSQRQMAEALFSDINFKERERYKTSSESLRKQIAQMVKQGCRGWQPVRQAFLRTSVT